MQRSSSSLSSSSLPSISLAVAGHIFQQLIFIGCPRRDSRPYTSVRRSDPRAKGRIAIDPLAEIHIAGPENWVHRINLTLVGFRPSLKGDCPSVCMRLG